MNAATARLDDYRRRLRWAAVTVLGIRLLAAAGACGLIAFAATAWLLGPMTPIGWLCIGWAAIFGATAWAVAWSLGPWLSLREHGALGIVSMRDPELLSPLQSAFELAGETAYSKELVIAQRLGVLEALKPRPVRRFIPWPWLVRPAVAALVLVAVMGWWSLGSPRGSAGAYALLHADRDAELGVLTGRAVAGTRAKLVFPDYMNRPDEVLEDADHLVIPRGTTVDYQITPIGSAARIVVELPGRHVQARRAGSDFAATFIADVDGPLRLHVESAAGERRIDHRARSVTVQPDQDPTIRLVSPEDDVVAEQREAIPLAFSASDDYGVQESTLIIKLPDGEHLRRPLFGPPEAPRSELGGETTVYLEEFSLEPADAVSVWFEAKDVNRIDGPGLARSETRTLTLASDITRRRQRIFDLEAILDGLLNALAVRLENPVRKSLKEAVRQMAAAQSQSDKVIDLLRDVGDHPGARTTPLLLDMRKRLERLTEREQAVYRSGAAFGRRRGIGRRFVSELENDTLLVADLISQARLNDAAEIALEIEQLRREMTSLISELRRGQSPELQRALLTALDRAERRMRALREQLAQSMRFVPGEFVNSQSAQANRSDDAIRDLRDALASGDLDAAERALEELGQTVDAMARALSQTEDSLVEATFGPRERALMEAMDTMRDIEVQQQQLATQARRIGDRAVQRAAKGADALTPAAQRALEEQSQKIAQELDALPRDAMGPYDRDLQNTAKERIKDFQEAVRRGDLGEALSMAGSASSAADQLARDLELSALMFRGRRGQTSAAADRAGQVAADAYQLREATQRMLPDVQRGFSDRDRERMEQQAIDQKATREATHKLARRLREDVDGVPVSEQAAETLESIEQPMQRARKALQESDPLAANKEQEAAADQLRRLRQQLESRQRRGGGGQRNGQRSGNPRSKDRVEIPNLSSDADELAWRRRVLDAMKGDPPEGYRQAVQDYYERLLR